VVLPIGDWVPPFSGSDPSPRGLLRKGRLASAHFIQFGKDYADARDEFAYAYFPAADDGNSYWENGDYILLGRVPKDKILVRSAWEFYTGLNSSGQPPWSKDDRKAQPVFRYPRMTGENHVNYNQALKRYFMGNYGFHDGNLNPRPNHQLKPWPASACFSTATICSTENRFRFTAKPPPRFVDSAGN
jgi:hypothetical protein